MPSRITISTAFEGGSIGVEHIGAGGDIALRLLADENAADTHWFYFRLAGAAGIDCRMTLVNSDSMARLAGRDEVPDCWTGYRPFVSDDGRHWVRTGAEYEGGRFTICHRPARDLAWFAYFVPYTMERHAALLGRCLADPRVELDILGTTPDGHDLEMLTIGVPGPGKPRLWIVGRQHASETMASWFMEGFLARLLDRDDALARALVDSAVFHVVPVANPDGCVRGNTRTNALAMNLNRAWADPEPETAPEVVAIRARMREEGVDFFLDVHGDEELPYVFLGGPLEIPSRSARLATLFARYQHAMESASPDYRASDPYPGGPPAEADLRMAWNWVAEEFGCLTVLLEQPFKDTAHMPDATFGWSPARCGRFGAATLPAIAEVLPELRSGR
jgi:murein tripeptide amidase MpaA